MEWFYDSKKVWCGKNLMIKILNILLKYSLVFNKIWILLLYGIIKFNEILVFESVKYFIIIKVFLMELYKNIEI